MTEPVVRTAEAEDWPAVSALLAELGRPDVRDSSQEPEHRERFLGYLARPDAVALVAEAAGSVVGFVDLEFRQRLDYLSPQAWIPDLIVTESARSLGVGAALLRRAEETARERGCWGITLESAHWRTRAHAFYLREGWQDLGRSFSKSSIRPSVLRALRPLGEP
jgi:GNAT superfamily N-acetyltransferase